MKYVSKDTANIPKTKTKRFSAILGCFFLFLFSPDKTVQREFNELVVWNVGQGQFVSAIESDRCLHFDMGGEKVDSNKVFSLCKAKLNFLYISHDDRDHIKFIPLLSQRLDLKLCGSPKIFLKLKVFGNLSKLSKCSDWASKKDLAFKEEQVLSVNQKIENSIFKARSVSNAFGQVYLYKNFLFTGDSPIEAEKIWSKSLERQQLRNIRLALAGHHGSQTSNSEQMIRTLRPYAQIVVSSRTKRYGHPHPQVINRFKKFKHPMISTEDWGNLHFIYF